MKIYAITINPSWFKVAFSWDALLDSLKIRVKTGWRGWQPERLVGWQSPHLRHQTARVAEKRKTKQQQKRHIQKQHVYLLSNLSLSLNIYKPKTYTCETLTYTWKTLPIKKPSNVLIIIPASRWQPGRCSRHRDPPDVRRSRVECFSLRQVSHIENIYYNNHYYITIVYEYTIYHHIVDMNYHEHILTRNLQLHCASTKPCR